MKDFVIATVIAIFVGVGFCFFVKFVENEVAPRFISDQMKKCEELGGKYNLYFSEFSGEYVESCNVLSRKIEL